METVGFVEVLEAELTHGGLGLGCKLSGTHRTVIA